MTNENKARNEYFYFTVKYSNCLLAKAKPRFQLIVVKKRQKEKFENNNFVLLPTIISHVFTAFFQKNKKKEKLPFFAKNFSTYFFSRFGLGL